MHYDLLIASASAGLPLWSAHLLIPAARLRPEDIIAYKQREEITRSLTSRALLSGRIPRVAQTIAGPLPVFDLDEGTRLPGFPRNLSRNTGSGRRSNRSISKIHGEGMKV